MTPSQVQEPLDPIQKVQALGEKRQQLLTREARLQVVHEQATHELTRLVEEMKTHGTSPETIETDLAEAEKKATEQVQTYEKDLTDYEVVVQNAEKALET